jgi:hypothetical protein
MATRYFGKENLGAKKSPLLAGFLRKDALEPTRRFTLVELLWHFLGWLFAFLWLGGCVVHGDVP